MSIVTKTAFMACRLAKLVDKVNEALEPLDELKDLGIDKIKELKDKYEAKIKALDYGSFGISDKTVKKVKALIKKLTNLVEGIVKSVKSMQKSFIEGIENKIQKIADEYEGCSVEVTVTNDYELDVEYVNGELELVTKGGFGIDVNPSFDLLNCDTSLVDDTIKSIRIITSSPGTLSVVDPTSLTL